MTKPNKKDTFLNSLEGNKSLLEWPEMQAVVQNATDTVANMDFPTSRTEKWKYTKVGRLTANVFESNASKNIKVEDYAIPGMDAMYIVFVNGEYQADLSDTNQEVSVKPFSDVLRTDEGRIAGEMNLLTPVSEDIFTAINTAYLTDGIRINIEKNVQLKKPVHILHICEGEQRQIQNRILLSVGKSANASFVQSIVNIGESTQFCNVITEMKVAENAVLNWVKIEEGNCNSFVKCLDAAILESNSRFNINTHTVNGNWVRNNLNIILNGQNIETSLNGAWRPTGKEHIDNQTVVDHKFPHCDSNEVYKGIVMDSATGVFNGKVYVRVDAQKTNAYQQNANILLGDNATMNAKPELEIYADDVKCSHGSTTGQIDEEAIFYLMARGINRDAANALMVTAFLEDTMENIAQEEVKDYLRNKLEQALTID